MSFSCLISCYKNDNPIQLSKCLDSLINQSLKANEIVFVKDGELSKDLEKILNLYIDKLPFVFVNLPTNKGLGNALNEGLLVCKNNIVIRMDTDDICLPNRFEKQYNYLIKNKEVDIVGSWAYDIDIDDNIIGERKYPLSHDKIYQLMWTNPIIHPAVAFRKDKILKIGSYDIYLKRRQDYELWIRAAYEGLKFSNIGEFLLLYRFTENYYKKNNTKVAYDQALMGFNGARKLDLPFYTKIAVFIPVLRSLLPSQLIGPVHKLMSKFDPRKS
ncbi:glycosyltransferase [Empedobacter falsenii]